MRRYFMSLDGLSGPFIRCYSAMETGKNIELIPVDTVSDINKPFVEIIHNGQQVNVYLGFSIDPDNEDIIRKKIIKLIEKSSNEAEASPKATGISERVERLMPILHQSTETPTTSEDRTRAKRGIPEGEELLRSSELFTARPITEKDEERILTTLHPIAFFLMKEEGKEQGTLPSNEQLLSYLMGLFKANPNCLEACVEGLKAENKKFSRASQSLGNYEERVAAAFCDSALFFKLIAHIEKTIPNESTDEVEDSGSKILAALSSLKEGDTVLTDPHSLAEDKFYGEQILGAFDKLEDRFDKLEDADDVRTDFGEDKFYLDDQNLDAIEDADDVRMDFGEDFDPRAPKK